MARYSEDIIEEVKNSVDLVEIASGYMHLKRNGSGYMGCCPFHKEKTPSLHIDPDKQLYHCFGCGSGGTVLQFIMAGEGVDFADALKILAEKGGVTLPEADGGGADTYKRKQEMYAMNKDAARFFYNRLFAPDGAKARAYLQKRALTSKTVASFGLGYAPEGWDNLLKHLESKGYRRDLIIEAGLCIRSENGAVYDRFRGRIMYPIFDVRNNLIGFGGRIMDGDGAKYLNSPESIVYDKGKNLYALNKAKKSKRGYYILVEGYMDVISLHQAGIDCAVAGCGTALTEAQARLIAKGNSVYLCYDMDEAGQKALSRAETIFRGLDARLKVIRIPNGKDADEFVRNYGAEAFEKLLDNSSTVTGNRMDTLLSKYDLDDVSQKVEMLGEAAKVLGRISNAVEREAYIHTLSRKTGISVSAIETEVRKAGGKLMRKEVNSAVRQSVAPVREASPRRPQSRNEKAQSNLLSLICEDKSTYDKLKNRLDENLFSPGLHRDIFLKTREIYADGNASAQDKLLAAFPGRENELASIIIKSNSPDDPIEAAADYIKVIETEALNEQIALAQKNGDIALLEQLIKDKHRKAGI